VVEVVVVVVVVVKVEVVIVVDGLFTEKVAFVSMEVEFGIDLVLLPVIDKETDEMVSLTEELELDCPVSFANSEFDAVELF